MSFTNEYRNEITIEVGKDLITNVDCEKLIGVKIDSKLSF